MLEERSYQLIKDLTQLQGIAGHEARVRDYMAHEMEGLVDRLEISGLGNLFGIKKSKLDGAPRVMLAAHMDEVGFMVRSINDNGTLQVIPIGGWNVYAIPAQRFTLMTRQGDYPVVSAAVAPHLLRGKEASQLRPEDILFDGGFTSKQEAQEYGVRPGDSIVPEVKTVLTANQKHMIGKAWDNRYGCALIIETLEALKGVELEIDLIAGATVQEEVGLRGVKGAVNRYKPDLFIAVDCSPAGDSEEDKQAMGQLGQGFLLRIQDPGMITHRGLAHYIEDLAQDQAIKYQAYFSQGGTDAVAAHTLQEGIPSAVIGVPARYIHGHQSLYNLADYQAAKEIVSQLLTQLNQVSIDNINKN